MNVSLYFCFQLSLRKEFITLKIGRGAPSRRNGVASFSTPTRSWWRSQTSRGENLRIRVGDLYRAETERDEGKNVLHVWNKFAHIR